MKNILHKLFSISILVCNNILNIFIFKTSYVCFEKNIVFNLILLNKKS
jgi:hypothetical protein